MKLTADQMQRLKRLRTLIRESPTADLRDQVVCGKLFLEVRNILAPREFTRWFRTNTSHSESVVYRMTSAARAFAKVPPPGGVSREVFRNVSRKHVSRRTRQTLIELVLAGEVEAVADLPTEATPSRKADAARALGKKTETLPERVLRQFLLLVAKGELVTLHQSDDTENEGQIPILFTFAVTDREGRQERHSNTDVLLALAQATGEVRERLCNRCGESKPLQCYSVAASYCKSCEAARVKEYQTARRKAAKDAEAAQSSGSTAAPSA